MARHRRPARRRNTTRTPSAPLPSACAAAANRAPTGERESSAHTPAWQRSPSPSARSTPAVALCELHAICRN
ncbi:hypothetical protein EJB05_44743, partial [Eragrostis curvula]